MIDADKLAWDKMDGLIPAIVQDCVDGEVRMVGYVDRAAWATTIETGFVTFFSRSKQRLWTKGETSGNRLRLVDARADCDGDAILLTVDAQGPTCHLGTSSCFGDSKPQAHFLEALEQRVKDRSAANPDESYTARLRAAGVKRISQKVGEEAIETALAAVSGNRDELISETSDLIYHLTVLLAAEGVSWDDVGRVLSQRR